MKILSLLFFSILFLVLFNVFSLYAEDAGQPGRYQLVQVKYVQWDSNSNASTENNDLFLLDTTTGDASIYVATTTNGKQIRSWTPAIFDETKS